MFNKEVPNIHFFALALIFIGKNKTGFEMADTRVQFYQDSPTHDQGRPISVAENQLCVAT